MRVVKFVAVVITAVPLIAHAGSFCGDLKWAIKLGKDRFPDIHSGGIDEHGNTVGYDFAGLGDGQHCHLLHWLQDQRTLGALVLWCHTKGMNADAASQLFDSLTPQFQSCLRDKFPSARIGDPAPGESQGTPVKQIKGEELTKGLWGRTSAKLTVSLDPNPNMAFVGVQVMLSP